MTASQGVTRVTTTTDESGRYDFPNLAPGTYTMEVRMFGFRNATKQLAIGPGTPSTEWSLELQPRPTQAQRSQPPEQGGFRNVAADLADQAEPTPPPDETRLADSSNETFLVNGRLSSGLQNGQEDFGMRGPLLRMGDGMPPGMEGQFPQAGPGGPGGGRFGGGGFPGGGGRGGFGGGRGGPRGQRPGGNGAFIGNRANRGRQGIRGQASFSLDNSALDARPFSLTGQDVPQAAYARARASLNVGGPLRIPKILEKDTQTFFFLSYFATRSKTPYKNVATVPTADERAGDFSNATENGPFQIYMPRVSPSLVVPGCTTSSSVAIPFPGNRIPKSCINSAALGLLNFFPSANQPGLVQNYQILTAYPQDTDNFSVRVNQNITKTDRLALNLNLQRRNGQPMQLFGFQDNTSGTGVSSSVSYTKNLGARTLSVLSFNFNRNRNDTLPYFANKTDVATDLGIQGTSSNPINFGPPNLSFTNFGALSDASPVLSRIQAETISENVSTVKGEHTITLGLSYKRQQFNVQTDSNARGTFTFTGLATSAFDSSGNPLPSTGFDLADFLLGLPQSSSVRFGDTSTYFRGNQYGAFGQDDWHALPNLTINLGLRWEYFSPLAEKYGRIANLDIAPYFAAVSVVTPGEPGKYSGSLPATLLRPDKHDFAPRGAIAWKPAPNKWKTLQLRAGYGIYYNPSVYNSIATRLAAQPPFANTNSLNTSLANVLTIQNGLLPNTQQKQILNTYAVNPDYQVGYAQTWNAALQTELPRSLILEIGYLGTKGTNLDIQTLPNRAPPGSPLTAEQRRQIGNATGFTFETAEGNSIYHALQVRVMRRMRRGLGIYALYTYGKSIDDSSTLGGAGNTVAQDAKDLRAERGLSSFDQRHNFSLTSTWSSPVRENRWLKDWTLQGRVTLATGTPLTARVLGNQADTGGTGSIGSGRAEATGLPVNCCGQFFNLAAFKIPPLGQFGNSGRNVIEGPATFALNSSIGRSINLDERRRLEFRLEATNLTNHVNFTNLATTVNASNYGLPLATSAMRTLNMVVRFRF